MTEPEPVGEASKALEPGPAKVKKIIMMLVRSFFIALLIVFAAAYIYFSPVVLVPNYLGDILLMPMPPGPEYLTAEKVTNLKPQDITYTNSNGDKLHAWYYKNPDAKKTVLFCHGNAGNLGGGRLYLAKALLEAGASVFIFDYRAYGKSEGKKNLPGLIDDACSAYDYVVNDLKVSPSDIVLYGESIGGSVASTLYGVKHKECCGIILDSTFTSLLGIAKKKVPLYSIYPDFLASDPKFSSIEVISGKHPPLLIIHGTVDGAIPYSEAQENFAAASEPKKLVTLPNSGHNDKSPDAALYSSALKEFIGGLNKPSE